MPSKWGFENEEGRERVLKTSLTDEQKAFIALFHRIEYIVPDVLMDYFNAQSYGTGEVRALGIDQEYMTVAWKIYSEYSELLKRELIYAKLDRSRLMVWIQFGRGKLKELDGYRKLLAILHNVTGLDGITVSWDYGNESGCVRWPDEVYIFSNKPEGTLTITYPTCPNCNGLGGLKAKSLID